MKKIAILSNNNEILTNTIANYFVNKNIEVCGFGSLENFDSESFDIVLFYDFNGKLENICEGKFFNIHPSLLPAFGGENAIEEAFKSGIKISGITIADIKTSKIIAQYPVLIRNLMHYDEYKNEINKAIAILAPPVAEALLENKIFDFESLLSGGGCSGCGGQCRSCK